MKSSLIPSIIGQNDSYLAEFFLKRDYAAHRIVCHSSPFNTAGTDGHLSTIPWNFGLFYCRSAGQWRQTLLWLSIGHRHNHVIRTFCKMAFAELGMGLKWKDKGLNEKDTNRKSKKVAIAADSHFFRPIKMALLREGAPPLYIRNWNGNFAWARAPRQKKNGYGSSRLDPNEPADAIPYEI